MASKNMEGNQFLYISYNSESATTPPYLDNKQIINIRISQQNLVESLIEPEVFKEKYVPQKDRYLQIVFYTINFLLVCIVANATASISLIMEKIYVSDFISFKMNFFLFYTAKIIMTIPACILTDKYGLKLSQSIGCILCIISCWIKYLVNTWDWFFIIGQIGLGISEPFFIFGSNKMAATWFQGTNRAIIASIPMIGLILNQQTGNLMSGYWFQDYSQEIDCRNSYKEGKQRIQDMFLAKAILISIVQVVFIFVVKKKPAIPPSFSQRIKRDKFLKGLKKLVKNPNYIKLILSNLILITCTVSFNLLDIPVLIGAKFSQSDVNTFFLVMIIGSVFGIAIIGLIFQKVQQFIRIASNIKMILFWGVKVGMQGGIGIVLYGLGKCFLALAVQQEIYFGVMGLYFIMGFGIVISLAIISELIVEITYPVGECLSIAIFTLPGYICGVIVGLIVSNFIDNQDKVSNLSNLIINMGSGLLILFGVIILNLIRKSQLIRTQIDYSNQINIIEELDNDINSIYYSDLDETMNEQELKTQAIYESNLKGNSLENSKKLKLKNYTEKLQEDRQEQRQNDNFTVLNESQIYQLNKSQQKKSHIKKQQHPADLDNSSEIKQESTYFALSDIYSVHMYQGNQHNKSQLYSNHGNQNIYENVEIFETNDIQMPDGKEKKKLQRSSMMENKISEIQENKEAQVENNNLIKHYKRKLSG